MKKPTALLPKLFTIVSALFCLISKGQTYNSLPNIMTPEVASLGKFGSYPVSYYTGTINVPMPLHTLKENDISIDISLQYDASGFVPNKEAGVVGLNWSLLAGGVITRVVNWAPDDRIVDVSTGINLNTNKGYIYGMLEANLGKYDKEYLRKLSFLHFDSQNNPSTDLPYEYSPDVFSFNFNGYHGRFFLGNDGNVKVSADKNYKVDLTNLLGQNDLCQCKNSEISITTDEGDIYKFGGDINTLEISYPYPNPENYAISCKDGTINAWYLKSITTRNGRLINFNYEPQIKAKEALSFTETNHALSTDIDYAYEKIYLNERFETLFNGSGQLSTNTTSKRYKTLIKTAYLSSITTPTSTVSFIYSLKAKPIYGSSEIIKNSNISKQLDKIEVKDFQGKIVSKIGFEYVLYGTDYNGYRQFLRKVNFTNPASAVSNSYAFDYYKTINLPHLLTKGVDIWGYYNGKDANGSLIPSVNSGTPNFDINLSTRAADVSFCDVGLLKTITYPTGGWSEFRYEGHDYSKVLRKQVPSGMIPVWINEVGNVGGARIKEINNSAGVKQTFIYKTSYTPTRTGLASSGILTDHNVFYLDLKYYYNSTWPEARNAIVQDNNIAPSSSYGESPIGYSEVTEINSEGYTKYYYSTQETNPDKYSLGSDSYKLTPASDNSIAGTNYHQQMKRLVKYSSCDLERGQLLKVEVYKDGQAVPIRETINQYNADPSRYNESVIGFNFPHESAGWAIYHSYALYHFQNGLTKQIVKEVGNNGIALSKTTNLSYVSNSNPLLREKSELNSKKETITSIYKYPTDPEYATQQPYNDMVSRYMIAQVIQEAAYKNNTTLLRLQKNNYKLWLNTTNPNTNKNIIAPEYVQTQLLNGSLVTKIRYYAYDVFGNVLSASKENDNKTFIVWDYKQAYPIAQIVGADGSDVAYTSFEADGTGGWMGVSATSNNNFPGVTGNKYYSQTAFSIYKSGLSSTVPYVVSYWSKNGAYAVAGTQPGWPKQLKTISVNGQSWTCFMHIVSGIATATISGSGAIDELRLYPNHAQMTTYTYDPLIGMTAQCDANSHIMYYTYDAFGRVVLVRNEDRNIVKRYCYNYAGQAESCTMNIMADWQEVSLTCEQVDGKNTGNQIKVEQDVNPNSLSYGITRQSIIANTTACPLPLPPIYARMEETNWYSDLDREYATVLIKFYSDAACTIPYSVSNLPVKYKKVQTPCSGTASTINYTVTCTGTQYSLGNQLKSWDDGGIHCTYYSFSVAPGTNYTAK